MKTRSFVCLAALLLSMFSPAATAQSIPPPHPPGTICYTPYFWCWAQPPGPPGSACTCASQKGFISGVRG